MASFVFDMPTIDGKKVYVSLVGVSRIIRDIDVERGRDVFIFYGSEGTSEIELACDFESLGSHILNSVVSEWKRVSQTTP